MTDLRAWVVLAAVLLCATAYYFIHSRKRRDRALVDQLNRLGFKPTSSEVHEAAWMTHPVFTARPTRFPFLRVGVYQSIELIFFEYRQLPRAYHSRRARNESGTVCHGVAVQVPGLETSECMVVSSAVPGFLLGIFKLSFKLIGFDVERLNDQYLICFKRGDLPGDSIRSLRSSLFNGEEKFRVLFGSGYCVVLPRGAAMRVKSVENLMTLLQDAVYIRGLLR